MASIRREIEIDQAPDTVWGALRDWGALHELASGFVVGCERQGNARVVTFASGAVLHEEILGCDDQLPAARVVDHGRPVHAPQRWRRGAPSREWALAIGLDERPASGRAGRTDRQRHGAGADRDQTDAGGRTGLITSPRRACGWVWRCPNPPPRRCRGRRNAARGSAQRARPQSRLPRVRGCRPRR